MDDSTFVRRDRCAKPNYNLIGDASTHGPNSFIQKAVDFKTCQSTHKLHSECLYAQQSDGNFLKKKNDFGYLHIPFYDTTFAYGIARTFRVVLLDSEEKYDMHCGHDDDCSFGVNILHRTNVFNTKSLDYFVYSNCNVTLAPYATGHLVVPREKEFVNHSNFRILNHYVVEISSPRNIFRLIELLIGFQISGTDIVSLDYSNTGVSWLFAYISVNAVKYVVVSNSSI